VRANAQRRGGNRVQKPDAKHVFGFCQKQALGQLNFSFLFFFFLAPQLWIIGRFVGAHGQPGWEPNRPAVKRKPKAATATSAAKSGWSDRLQKTITELEALFVSPCPLPILESSSFDLTAKGRNFYGPRKPAGRLQGTPPSREWQM